MTTPYNCNPSIIQCNFFFILASKHEQELFEANVNALPSFRKPEVSEAVQERQNISMEHATPFTMNGEPAENDEFTKSSTMVTNDEIMQNNMNGKNGVVHENIIVDSTARKTLMRESELIPATPGASDSGSDEALEKVIFGISRILCLNILTIEPS